MPSGGRNRRGDYGYACCPVFVHLDRGDVFGFEINSVRQQANIESSNIAGNLGRRFFAKQVHVWQGTQALESGCALSVVYFSDHHDRALWPMPGDITDQRQVQSIADQAAVAYPGFRYRSKITRLETRLPGVLVFKWFYTIFQDQDIA